MKNLEIAALFDRTADVLAVKGEDSFRMLAYRKIARTLQDLPQDVAQLAHDGALKNVPGIGEGSVKRIEEYLRTGHIAEFEELWGEIPAGVMEMMKIPTVGPKTAALLWHEAGITSVQELKEKIEKGQLPEIKGIGAKKIEKIQQNIAFLAQSAGRIPIGKALPVAAELVAFVEKLKGVQQAACCGSLRRGKETIGDIDIAAAADAKFGQAISDAIVAHPYVAEVLGAGATKTSFRTANGIQVDVRVVPPASFGAALQYFTGSKEHNVRLREIAIKQGYKLNEWGLFKGDKPIAGQTEESIYEALGLRFIPPEMREDHGEIEAAALERETKKAGKSSKTTKEKEDQPPIRWDGPWEVLELSDIRGDLHMHTNASDGGRSIEEMVAEAKRRGYQYCAITDHSKSQFQANGLRVDRLLNHIKAVHAVAKEAKGILVLAGSEVDILAEGTLDYEDEVLAKLDWVVASPHAALSQDAEAATTRLMHAVANPYVHVIGHPTGRLVPNRRGIEPDMARVIFAAARNGVAMEINANYHRLDLRDTHARLAVEAGVPLCINTDAHDFSDMDQMLYGVLTARRAWARKSNVLNTWPVEALTKWLKERKAQAQW